MTAVLQKVHYVGWEVGQAYASAQKDDWISQDINDFIY